jgi:hypothetical protein
MADRRSFLRPSTRSRFSDRVAECFFQPEQPFFFSQQRPCAFGTLLCAGATLFFAAGKKEGQQVYFLAKKSSAAACRRAALFFTATSPFAQH